MDWLKVAQDWYVANFHSKQGGPDWLYASSADIRAAALEEAAKVAEAQAEHYARKREDAEPLTERWERFDAYLDAANHISESVRALKEKP